MGTYQVTTEGGTYEVETEAPSYGEDVVSNAGKEIASLPGQVPTMAKQGLGIASAPMDALKAIPQMIRGKSPSETSLAEDIQPIIEGNKGTVNTLAHPIDSFRKAPIATASTFAGLAGAPKLLEDIPVNKAPEVPKPINIQARDQSPSPVPAPEVAAMPKATPEALPVAAPPAANPLQGLTDKAGGALDEVNNFLTQKYGKAAAKPGFFDKAAKYLQETSRQLGSKDLGMQPRQIQSMGPGFKGLEKAEALVDYAREKGYFDPKLSDLARKEKIKATLEQTGQKVGAIREIADKRGQAPVPFIKNQVEATLQKQYGIDAPAEIKKVLAKIDAAEPTFSGMADLATELNKAKTPAVKMGQHPGPTTDAANLVSQINNDAIRKVLNPQEQAAYTESLKDFGAHKKLEQTVAASERRGMAARSNQRGVFGRLWQEALDRGGYRLGANVADRTAKVMLKNPGKVGTLPQFFEELAHQANDVIDEALE